MTAYKVLKTLEKTDFGDKFSVEKLLIEIPDGQRTEFFMRSARDYAIIIPLLSDTELVMVEQPRLGVENQGPSLEFPMGQVAGKEGEAVAVTELKEETGYTAGTLMYLGKLYPATGWSTQKGHIYVATDLKEGTPEPEPFELMTVKRVKIAELHQYIAAGKVFDMPTIAAFHLFITRYAEKKR